MTRLLVVAPAYNEADVLPEFIAAFLATKVRMASRATLRLLIVDDGSVDKSLALLKTAAAEHPDSVGYLSFAANAGHQAALIAGLCDAGDWPDAIVTMDADLEHPFEVLPNLLDAWQQTGSIVVHAMRRDSHELPWVKRVPSRLFYRSAAALTGLDLAPGQADFKLWDASTVRAVTSYLPHIGSLRVFAAWLEGRKAAVYYDQAVRAGRQSRFTFSKNIELAAISIIRFSNVPLKAITVLGASGLIFSIGYGAFVLLASMRGETIPGYSSTVLIVMTMGCLQLIALGILASYLRRLVFARDLPAFIVRERHIASTHEASGTAPK